MKVTLYTNREFTDVTRAPSWLSALNDGEIRIPIEGLVFRFGLLDTARACRTNTMGIGAEEMDDVLARLGNRPHSGCFEGMRCCGAPSKDC